MRRLGSAVPVLAVIAVAFLLRVWGVRYCLPYGFGHVDEEIIVRDAMQMGAARSLRPTFFDYPSLYTYLSLMAIGAKFAVFRVLGFYASANDLALEYALRPGYIHLLGRMMSVVAGTLTVGLTYMLGRRVADTAVALTAAIMMALALEHVTQSHWALPDVTMTFLYTAALYLSYRLVQTGSLKTYIAAGLVAGLAISTKYNAYSIIAVLLAAHILRVRSEKPKSAVHILDRRLAAGAACVAAAFIAGSPYWVIDPKPYFQAMQWNQSHMKLGHLGASEGVRWLWVLDWLLRTEKALGALMILGMARGIIVRRREETLLLVAALAALITVGSLLKTSLYFFLPAYPTLCILGALVIAGPMQRLIGLTRRGVLLPVAAVLICVPQLIGAIGTSIRMSAPDTRLIARDWIERNIPSGTTIALDEPRAYCAPLIAGNYVQHWSKLCPPIHAQLEQAIEDRPVYGLIATRAMDLTTAGDRPSDYAVWSRERKWLSVEELRRQKTRYLILSSFNYDRFWSNRPPPEGNPLRPVFFDDKAHYEEIMSSADLELVKTISPGRWNLGPTLRIYRLRGMARDPRSNSLICAQHQPIMMVELDER